MPRESVWALETSASAFALIRQGEEVIAEAVEIARSDNEHRAAREGISVRFAVEPARLPPVNAAADLRYVFINLLLNAGDARPRGGTLRVRGTVQESKAVITVEHEGTGIPEEHLRSVFRPFFTTHARAAPSSPPTALGGAVFTLTFPPPQPPSQVPDTTSQHEHKPARQKRSPRR